LPTDLFPAALKLADRCVLVVGAGRVAERKVRDLRVCGARVTMVAPQACEALQSMAAAGEVSWHQRPFQRGDVDGVTIVVAASGDRDVNRQVVDAAHEANLLVNAVDDPDRCDFYLPAVVRRGALCVTVSTSGASPAFARHLAEELDEWLEQSLGTYVELLAEARVQILRDHPEDPKLRFRLASALPRTDARERVLRGDLEGARRVLRECLADGDKGEPRGEG